MNLPSPLPVGPGLKTGVDEAVKLDRVEDGTFELEAVLYTVSVLDAVELGVLLVVSAVVGSDVVPTVVVSSSCNVVSSSSVVTISASVVGTAASSAVVVSSSVVNRPVLINEVVGGGVVRSTVVSAVDGIAGLEPGGESIMQVPTATVMSSTAMSP